MSAPEDPRPAKLERTGDEPAPAAEDVARTDASDAPPPREREEEDFPPEDLPEEGPLLDEVDMRDLLRGAMQAPPAAPPNLLGGVQRRLRTRSRGKFYADGWSTTRSPRSLYLTTSVIMLVLIAFVFLVLIPWGGGVLP